MYIVLIIKILITLIVIHWNVSKNIKRNKWQVLVSHYSNIFLLIF